MPPINKSFIVLSIQGETVGSVENATSPPPSDCLTRQQEDEANRTDATKRRNPLWEHFSFSNLFKSKREKSDDLTSQLRHSEEVNSSNSSTSDHNSKAPYARMNGPQSSDLPPPQFYRERLQRHEQGLPESMPHTNANTKHPWNQSASSSDGPPRKSLIADKIKVTSSGEATMSTGEGSRWQEFKEELKSLFVDLVEYGKAKTWKKKILTVLLCVVSVLVFYDLLFGKQDYIVTWLHSFIVWMTTHHAAAVFAFVGIFVVSTLAFVPPTLLVFGAGYAFTMALDSVLVGVTAAVLSCFLGSSIGAIIAFLRSRYMMRDLVKLFAARYPLVRGIDQALKVNHGFWIMLLLRLCPIIPFNGLNYCCGITGVTLHEFTLSLVGILPFQIFTVILGATAGALELQDLKNDAYTAAEKWAFIGFTVTGVIFIIVAIVYVWRLVKLELRRELSLTPEEFECVIRNDGGSSSFSFRLQEDDNASLREISSRHISSRNTSLRDGMDAGQSSDNSIPFQEEGEEWFWIWA
uniref:VTT domain-containing protein n=1 Tax=Pseudo-nitzschia arenysensis TaxID=697910 RepID=A0A7R9ZU85_9STRA